MLRKVVFVCIGNLKKRYLKELENVYSYGFEIVIIDGKNIDDSSMKILNFINGFKNRFCVLFDIKGKPANQFCGVVLEKFLDGRDMVFIVGGSDGVNMCLKKYCDLSLKLSDFTYSHQIFRITAMIFVKGILLKYENKYISK